MKLTNIDERILCDQQFRDLARRVWDSPAPASPKSHPWPFNPKRWKESHVVTQRNRLKKKRQREKAWNYLLAKFGTTDCLICGKPGKEIDHVIPVTWGGTSDNWNLQPLCGLCNATKGNQLPDLQGALSRDA